VEPATAWDHAPLPLLGPDQRPLADDLAGPQNCVLERVRLFLAGEELLAQPLVGGTLLPQASFKVSSPLVNTSSPIRTRQVEPLHHIGPAPLLAGAKL
jgi:hypothetical protein